MFLKHMDTVFKEKLLGSKGTTNGLISTAGRRVESGASLTFYDVGSSFKYYMTEIDSYVGSYFGKETAGSSTTYLITSVVFGSGNDEPTLDDFTLSGSVVGGLSANNVTTSTKYTESDDGSLSICVTYTISNTTGNDITIGEVGLCLGLIIKLESGTSYKSQVLIERTALETPITIPVGEVGRVIYTITLGSLFASTATGEVTA